MRVLTAAAIILVSSSVWGQSQPIGTHQGKPVFNELTRGEFVQLPDGSIGIVVDDGGFSAGGPSISLGPPRDPRLVRLPRPTAPSGTPIIINPGVPVPERPRTIQVPPRPRKPLQPQRQARTWMVSTGPVQGPPAPESESWRWNSGTNTWDRVNPSWGTGGEPFETPKGLKVPNQQVPLPTDPGTSPSLPVTPSPDPSVIIPRVAPVIIPQIIQNRIDPSLDFQPCQPLRNLARCFLRKFQGGGPSLPQPTFAGMPMYVSGST